MDRHQLTIPTRLLRRIVLRPVGKGDLLRSLVSDESVFLVANRFNLSVGQVRGLRRAIRKHKTADDPATHRTTKSIRTTFVVPKLNKPPRSFRQLQEEILYRRSQQIMPKAEILRRIARRTSTEGLDLESDPADLY